MNNPLIEQKTNDAGDTIYQMKTLDIDVVARLTGGIAPTITYMHGEKDVTDDIRAIRFHYEKPADYIENYAAFQSMLYQKSNVPLTVSTNRLASSRKTCPLVNKFYGAFFVFLLVLIPVFLVVLLK